MRFVTGITDGEVRALIESATAVVSPSLYEGFGLFPAEAATLGAALIVSDIAPHREGLRDLHHSEVQWVPAEDREGWAVAMRRAAGGPVAPSSVSQSAVLDRYSAVRLGSLLDGLYRDMLRLQKS